MSKFDKLIERILSLDNNLRFEEVSKVLEHLGYEKYSPHGGSSHVTFRKDGQRPITIPNHRRIKVVYVKIVKELIESNRNEY